LAPQLLRSISLGHFETVGLLACLQSFGSWAALRAAGHVHCLHIFATCQYLRVYHTPANDTAACGSGSDDCSESEWSPNYKLTAAGDAIQWQVLDALATAAAACGCQLQELHIGLEDDGLPAWQLPTFLACALPNLRTFSIEAPAEVDVAVGAPLALLTALEELRLEGRSMTLDPAVHLPPSLTKLHLGFTIQEHNWKQVRRNWCRGCPQKAVHAGAGHRNQVHWGLHWQARVHVVRDDVPTSEAP